VTRREVRRCGVSKGYRRSAWYWLLELIRGPTKADLDYRTMLGATMALARSDIADEEARERLQEIAMSSEFGAQGVVQYMEQRRDSYLGDRAYRLAEAVMTGRTVKPQGIASLDRVRLEEELGRLPLEVAFERLASILPELSAWRTAVEEEGLAMHVPEMQRLEKIVGPKTRQSNALARSDVAYAVSMTYLRVLAGDTRRGDGRTPYFVIVSNQW
jgi:hypothetical protein